MGRWFSALLLVGCAGAAYPRDEGPGVRARVVCAVADSSPKRWTDVVIRGEPSSEACEVALRDECDGRGDIARACSTEPLAPPLVPRGSFLLEHELRDRIQYEAFATADECESARAEGVKSPAIEWLEAQIANQAREVEAAQAAVREGERRLAEARAAQTPDIPLVQLEVQHLRRNRDAAQTLLVAIRDQVRAATTIACAPAGGA